MKHLFKHAKKYSAECICGPLFKLFEATLELFVPLVMKRIIDIGIAGGDNAYIIKMSLLLVGLGLLGFVCSVIAQFFSAKAAVGITAGIRRELLLKIQSLSHAELDNVGTSTLITRMTSDANQVQSGINLTLRLLLRSPFVVFGAAIMAFTIDTKAALTFAGVIPLLSVVVFGIMLICIPLYKKVQAKLDAVVGITRENLAGVRVIRAFRREENEKNDFDGKCEELTGVQNLVGRISSLMNPITYVLINFAVIILIYIGAVRVDKGILTQGAVIALYNYMSQILVELIKFANLIITMTKSVASENRIEKVFGLTSSLKDGDVTFGDDGKRGEIEFKGVSFTYKGAGEPSLSGIDFKTHEGMTVGIIGGTGAGKSTLVNLMPRFYDASEGEILVDGVPVKNYKLKTLRDKFGIVPQKALLFRGTVRENLLWGNGNATENELLDALEISRASDFVMQKENGIDCIVEQGGRNFSGGQRQRLTIARALVRRPEFLILDDSTSALDFATDAALRLGIKKLDYAPTVFIVSQRTSSIRNADMIIVLDDGKPVGIGTHEVLIENCQIYREIHESQLGKAVK